MEDNELDNALRTLDEHLKSRRLREQAQKQEEEWKKRLKSWLQDNGDEDDKGNYWLAVPEDRQILSHKENKIVTRVKLTKRTSINLDEDRARELLAEKNLLEKVLTTEVVEILDEDEILALNYSGALTDEELASIFVESKPSYALNLEEEAV